MQNSVLSFNGHHCLDDDIFQIVDIEQQLFVDNWCYQDIKEVLSGFGAGVLILKDNDNMMGYCIYNIVFEIAEILRIATCPNHQKKGVAQKLMNEFIQLCQTHDAERILLEVRANNTPAICFYQKNGFYQIDVRKNYYQDDKVKIDALILQKDIKRA